MSLTQSIVTTVVQPCSVHSIHLTDACSLSLSVSVSVSVKYWVLVELKPVYCQTGRQSGQANPFTYSASCGIWITCTFITRVCSTKALVATTIRPRVVYQNPKRFIVSSEVRSVHRPGIRVTRRNDGVLSSTTQWKVKYRLVVLILSSSQFVVYVRCVCVTAVTTNRYSILPCVRAECW